MEVITKLPLCLRRIQTLARTAYTVKEHSRLSRCCVEYATSTVHESSKTDYEGRDSKSKKSYKGLLGSGTLFLTGFGLGFYLSSCYAKDEARKEVLPSVKAALPSDPPEGGNNNRRQNFNFIADVVKTCAPSVVYIEIIDPRFNRVVSNGSGFIISDDGLILTNAHVVSSRGRNRLQVKLHDGGTFLGQVEDADMNSDLALVRIPCNKLPVMKLGVSSELQAGEWVVAIGSPLSLSNTVTAGVVSSTNRKGSELGLHGRGIDYIQTDASITFGNSGGPLVNLDGEVIGINSMKITAGISFAIPIDYAKQFIQKNKEKLQSKGWFGQKETPSARRRYMGITMVTLTPQLVLEMQQRNVILASDVTHGVLVVKVVIGSPAFNGGVKPGDVVTDLNGRPVESASDIYAALQSTTSLQMTVLRGREKLDLVIVPED